MLNVNIEAPDWLRQTESILEELNEGVVIVDTQLRVAFANKALLRISASSYCPNRRREGCKALFSEFSTCPEGNDDLLVSQELSLT